MDDTTAKRVNEMYQKGTSIQMIAREFRLTVEEVLTLTNNTDLMQVHTQGDLVDNPGPGATINRINTFDVPYSLN